MPDALARTNSATATRPQPEQQADLLALAVQKRAHRYGGNYQADALGESDVAGLNIIQVEFARQAGIDGPQHSEQYFSTAAPVVVGRHVLVGTGNDLDAPAFLQSFDPETGDLQWKWYATPQKKGDPGLDTWANLDAAIHGGGQMWIPGFCDPETRLYIVGTGNPTPAYTSQTRGEGDDLYTCSLVAINVDTGRLMAFSDIASRHA